MSQKSFGLPVLVPDEKLATISVVPRASAIPPRIRSASYWKGLSPRKALKILESRSQRVSPFRFPFLRHYSFLCI
jgi:hypothetical protein